MRKDFRIKNPLDLRRAYKNYRQTAHLAHYFHLYSGDDDSINSQIPNLQNSSGNPAVGNNVTTIRSSPYEKIHKYSSHIETDDTSYYRVPWGGESGKAFFNKGGPNTVAMWVNMPKYNLRVGGSTPMHQYLFNKMTADEADGNWATVGEIQIQYQQLYNRFAFVLNGTNEDPSAPGGPGQNFQLTVFSSLNELQSTGPQRQNEWFHIAITWDLSKVATSGPSLFKIEDMMSIYINGQKSPTVNAAGGDGGWYQWPTSPPTNGTSADVSKYWQPVEAHGDMLIARGPGDDGASDYRSPLLVYDLAVWNTSIPQSALLSIWESSQFFEGTGFLSLGPRVQARQEINVGDVYFTSQNTPRLNRPSAPYNDNEAIIFQRDKKEILQYPLGLPAAGIDKNLLVSSSLATPNSLPTIQAPGYPDANIIAKYYAPNQVSEGEVVWAPFNDATVLPNYEGSFYGPTTSIAGFSSPLRDKIQIILELPINAAATATRHSAWWDSFDTTDPLPGGDGNSVNINPHYDGHADPTKSGEFVDQDMTGFMYYNKSRGIWEQKGLNDVVTGEMLKIQDTAQETKSQQLTIAFEADRHLVGWPKLNSGSSNSMRLFYPGGMTYDNGQYPGGGQSSTGLGLTTTDDELAANVGFPMCSNYAPNAIQYFATGSQVFRMSDYISEPFLLEKVILEIPDTVARKVYDYSTNPNSPTAGRPQDDYIFFLMRQEKNYPGSNTNENMYSSGSHISHEKIALEVSSSVRYLICSGNAAFYNDWRRIPGKIPSTAAGAMWQPRNSPAFSHNFNTALDFTTDIAPMIRSGSLLLPMEPAVSSRKVLGNYFLPTWDGTNNLYLTQSVTNQYHYTHEGLWPATIPGFWPGGTSTLPLSGALTGSRSDIYRADLHLAMEKSSDPYYYLRAAAGDPTYNQRTFYEVNPYLQPFEFNFDARVFDSRTFKKFGAGGSETPLHQLTLSASWECSFADNLTEHNAPSPYLLFPEDELILGLEAALGWTATMAAGITADGLKADGLPDADIGELRVGANNITGSLLRMESNQVMTLRLYGSLVKDQKQAPKYPASSITQHNITEPIIGFHALDEYDISPIAANSGSYRQRLITGSMTIADGHGLRVENLGGETKTPAQNPGAFIFHRNIQPSQNYTTAGPTTSTVLTCSIPTALSGLARDTFYIYFLSASNNPTNGAWPGAKLVDVLETNPDGKMLIAPDEIWCRSNYYESYWSFYNDFDAINYLTIQSLYYAFAGDSSGFYAAHGKMFTTVNPTGKINGVTPNLLSTAWPYTSLALKADPGEEGNRIQFLQSSCSQAYTTQPANAPGGPLCPYDNWTTFSRRQKPVTPGVSPPGNVPDGSGGKIPNWNDVNQFSPPAPIAGPADDNIATGGADWIADWENAATVFYRMSPGGDELGIVSNSTSSLAGAIVSASPIRAVAASAADGTLGSYGSFNRFVTLVDNSEKYFDSAPPIMMQIWRCLNRHPSIINMAGVPADAVVEVGAPAGDLEVRLFGITNGIFEYTKRDTDPYTGFGDIDLDPYSSRWWGAYPFEPKFAMIPSTTGGPPTPVDRAFGEGAALDSAGRVCAVSYTISDYSYKGWGQTYVQSGSLGMDAADWLKQVTPGLAMGKRTDIKGSSQTGWGITMDSQTYGMVPNLGDLPEVSLKIFYGIGDGLGNLIESRPENDHFPTNEYTYTGPAVGGPVPDMNGIYPLYFKTCRRFRKPRGWKYGLINVVPQHPQAVFRSDHYGQFRDLLEQRKFSIFNEVGSMFPNTYNSTPPVDIRFRIPVWDRTQYVMPDGSPAAPNPGVVRTVPPGQTRSGNLSQYATSSLPFFDLWDPDGGPGGYPHGRERPDEITTHGYTFVIPS